MQNKKMLAIYFAIRFLRVTAEFISLAVQGPILTLTCEFCSRLLSAKGTCYMSFQLDNILRYIILQVV